MSGPQQRWIAEQPEPLGLLLDRRGERAALADGRVFVEGRRARDAEQALQVGHRVDIYPARTAAPAARVLYRNAGWVFAEKPAGIATEPDKRGSAGCLVQQIASEIGVDTRHIHALSRLDLGVSGVVLLATDEASRRQALAFRAAGQIQRRYVALAAGCPDPLRGEWSDPIQRPSSGPLRRAADPSDGSGKASRTRYVAAAVVGAGAGAASVLALEPITGRTHQLRVHCSAHGAPLFGDPSYAGPRRWVLANGRVLAFSRVLLHAAWVKLPHLPQVMAPIPREMTDTWLELGGEASAFLKALEVPVSAC